MKFSRIYKSLLAAVALTAAASTLTGCDEDLAVPPLSIPQSDWKANMTIADFKAKYWQTADNYNTLIGTNDDGSDIILGGRIIANDISGNIYQNVILQDETAAVTIAVAMKDMNKKYKVGEEMFINVTGLYAGKYSGLFEIGKDDVYTSGSTTTPQIGKMEEDVFLAHAQLNGLPDPSKVKVIEMTIDQFNQNKTNVDFVQKYQSQLIRLNGVSFGGGGEETWGERGTSHNTRYLYNQAGQSIAVDNSGMSDFNDQVLPAGHGDIIAIASYFRSAFQLVFVNNTDEYVIDFGGESYAPVAPESLGDGTAASPYSVGSVISGATGTGVWVTGYIVGWIDGMSLAEGAKFSVPATSTSNLLLAQTPDETNAGNCIPVALTNGSVCRTDLNLKDHADNLGKQVTIKGNLEKYFGAAGVKETTAYVWGDKGDDTATPPTPSTGTPKGTGTEADPYNAAAALQAASALGSGEQSATDVYVKGKVTAITELSTSYGNATYTIGDGDGSASFSIYRGYYLNGDKFTSEDQLKVGDEVVVCGKLTNYKGNTPQMNQGSRLISINSTGGSTGGDTSAQGDGTQANPYTASKALSLAQALSDTEKIENVYVKGDVSEITELSTSYGNATYKISDGTNAFSIYRGKYLNGEKFTEEGQLKVGDKVVVCGTIVNYKGNTPQMTTGSSLVSIN